MRFRHPVFKVSAAVAVIFLGIDMFLLRWWLAVIGFAALVVAIFALFFEKDALISAKKQVEEPKLDEVEEEEEPLSDTELAFAEERFLAYARSFEGEDRIKKTVYYGGHMLSMADLENEVLNETEIGREHIRMYADLVRYDGGDSREERSPDRKLSYRLLPPLGVGESPFNLAKLTDAAHPRVVEHALAQDNYRPFFPADKIEAITEWGKRFKLNFSRVDPFGNGEICLGVGPYFGAVDQKGTVWILVEPVS